MCWEINGKKIVVVSVKQDAGGIDRWREDNGANGNHDGFFGGRKKEKNLVQGKKKKTFGNLLSIKYF